MSLYIYERSRFRQVESFSYGFLSSAGLLPLFQTSILHLKCYFSVHKRNKTFGFKKWVFLAVLSFFLTVGWVKIYFVTELHARSETMYKSKLCVMYCITRQPYWMLIYFIPRCVGYFHDSIHDTLHLARWSFFFFVYLKVFNI